MYPMKYAHEKKHICDLRRYDYITILNGFMKASFESCALIGYKACDILRMHVQCITHGSRFLLSYNEFADGRKRYQTLPTKRCNSKAKNDLKFNLF